MFALARRVLTVMALLLVVVVSVAAVLAEPASAPRPARSPLETPVLAAGRAAALLARPAADDALVTRLGDLVAGAPPDTCLVVDVGGRRLVDHHPDLPLIPASTMKVAVATAALIRMGAGEVYRTVVRSAPPEHGVVATDLHLVGGGDPLLATAGYADSFTRQPQLFTPLESLADLVVAAGVERVDGSVVGDESRYDQVRYVPSWRPVYLTDHETGPMSALSVNDGFATFAPTKVPAADPAAHAAAVFNELLEERGVVVRDPPAVGIAPDLGELATLESAPLGAVVGQLLRDSDNQTGEMLLKELGVRFGGAGTTAIGSQVVEATLADHDVPVDGMEVVDGSGLDRGNRLTCRTLADLLELDAGGRAVAQGLAVVGESGTLHDRLVGTAVQGRVRAKTGSLRGVAALAGVAETSDGGQARFAFIANGVRSPAEGARLQDRLMTVLSEYPAAGRSVPGPGVTTP